MCNALLHLTVHRHKHHQQSAAGKRKYAFRMRCWLTAAHVAHTLDIQISICFRYSFVAGSHQQIAHVAFHSPQCVFLFVYRRQVFTYFDITQFFFPLRFCPAFGFSAVLFGTLLKCLRLCCSLHLTREAIVNQYNLSGATILCSINVSIFINMQFSGDWRFMLIIIFYYRLRVERGLAREPSFGAVPGCLL